MTDRPEQPTRADPEDEHQNTEGRPTWETHTHLPPDQTVATQEQQLALRAELGEHGLMPQANAVIDRAAQLWDYAELLTVKHTYAMNQLTKIGDRYEHITECEEACGNLSLEQVEAAIALAQTVEKVKSDDIHTNPYVIMDVAMRDALEAFRAAMAEGNDADQTHNRKIALERAEQQDTEIERLRARVAKLEGKSWCKHCKKYYGREIANLDEEVWCIECGGTIGHVVMERTGSSCRGVPQ